MQCTYCQQENEGTSTYCSHCGHALLESEQAGVSAVDSQSAGWVSCPDCGSEMTKAENETKDKLEKWWVELTGRPFPVRCEATGSVSRFSIDEIDEWLKGWILLDVGETPNEALSIALLLLRDDEEGIETYFETKQNRQDETRGTET